MSEPYEPLFIGCDLSLSGLEAAANILGKQATYELHVSKGDFVRAEVLAECLKDSILVKAIHDPALHSYEWFLRGSDSQRAVGSRGPHR